MAQDSTTINIDEIRGIYKEYCEKEEVGFSENDFEEFLKFLELDFYDWIKENLNQFSKQRD